MRCHLTNVRCCCVTPLADILSPVLCSQLIPSRDAAAVLCISCTWSWISVWLVSLSAKRPSLGLSRSWGSTAGISTRAECGIPSSSSYGVNTNLRSIHVYLPGETGNARIGHVLSRLGVCLKSGPRTRCRIGQVDPHIGVGMQRRFLPAEEHLHDVEYCIPSIPIIRLDFGGLI